MLRITKKTLSAFVILVLGLGFYGCTDTDSNLKNPVEPVPSDLPAEPVSNNTTGASQDFAPKTAYFAFDSDALSTEAKSNLNELAENLKTNKDKLNLQIEGHTDERGTVEYNLALGARRAEAVKNYLIQLDVDANRISTVSYGEEKPVEDGHNEAAWAKNRRAEFKVSPM